MQLLQQRLLKARRHVLCRSTICVRLLIGPFPGHRILFRDIEVPELFRSFPKPPDVKRWMGSVTPMIILDTSLPQTLAHAIIGSMGWAHFNQALGHCFLSCLDHTWTGHTGYFKSHALGDLDSFPRSYKTCAELLVSCGRFSSR